LVSAAGSDGTMVAASKGRPKVAADGGPDAADLSLPEAGGRLWQLAWPSIISELSVPLLGLVDTLVVGHMADARDLSGVALATSAYNPLLMIFNFLRMGTSGVTAQAFGAGDRRELMAGAARGICLGLFFGTLLCLLRSPLAALSFGCIEAPDADTLDRAETYYRTRVLGTPAALANFVVQAWLVGVQRPEQALAANLVLNVSNAVLCILLGWTLELGVAGVGAATAVANYLALAFGAAQIWRVSQQLPWLADSCSGQESIDWALVFDAGRLLKMATLNGNIFFRSVCVMFIVTDFTALSAQLGSAALAANNLLMQMQMLISFGADGFANAASAMVGEAIGRGRPGQLRTVFLASLRWAAILGLGFTLAFVLCGRAILAALTSHAEVVAYAAAYLPWQWAAPLLSVAAYLMDGVFVGATRPREMRDATFLALVAFAAVGHTLGGSNNNLWAAYLLHVVIRSAALLCWYPRIEAAAGLRAAQPLLTAEA